MYQQYTTPTTYIFECFMSLLQNELQPVKMISMNKKFWDFNSTYLLFHLLGRMIFFSFSYVCTEKVRKISAFYELERDLKKIN